ncbi:hypothetical protein Phi13:2_gp016 [Cellulophaga phage phi13:2]|uniref:Uncharacterized protein n=1 Tax=Cellulophaga phage phi13:2 TaxID=1328030 RepID=S0A2K8_9CAUD|nr:hypothetical protein Phi13:2_gp016 [Cellulophaga phage phi13:2]AGO49626.1 hypothetical protein Phi13:2_gp016 [Cellulophaga phage phi13:2]
MKRSSFLKSLLGIAVAPIAAAKIIEEIGKPEMLSGEEYFNSYFVKSRRMGHTGQPALRNHSSIIRGGYDIGYTWYDNEIEKTNAEFNMRFEHFIMNREPSEINSSIPSLLDNEKLT